jgi:hypothetical protein
MGIDPSEPRINSVQIVFADAVARGLINRPAVVIAKSVRIVFLILMLSFTA